MIWTTQGVLLLLLTLPIYTRYINHCDVDIKLPGCPCGNPFGSKRYMYRNGRHGCFSCAKGQYFDDSKSMQCEVCDGQLTSCKDNVSPNACAEKHCEEDIIIIPTTHTPISNTNSLSTTAREAIISTPEQLTNQYTATTAVPETASTTSSIKTTAVPTPNTEEIKTDIVSEKVNTIGNYTKDENHVFSTGEIIGFIALVIFALIITYIVCKTFCQRRKKVMSSP